MRQGPSSTVVLLAVFFSLLNTPAWADQSRGSYAANGQCYCFGELATSIRNLIVPTPVGGQTVSQVCKKIGAGPGLEKVNGVYNFAVYQDPQCGHGPFDAAVSSRDADCSGTLDGTYGTCQGVGPKWDLYDAFMSRQAPAAAKPANIPSADDKENKENVSKQTDSLDSSSAKPLKTIVARAVKNPKRELPELTDVQAQVPEKAKESKSSFEGRTVTIDGQRYLQARKGVKPIGGSVGSRIILDGLVFLKDDGYIDPADLYHKSDDAKNTVVRTIEPADRVPNVELLKDNSAEKLEPATVKPPPKSEAQLMQEKAQAELYIRRALIREKQAREQAMLEESLIPEASDVKPETVLDEVMRKRRRADLEKYWAMQVDTPAELSDQTLLSDQSAVSEATKQADVAGNEVDSDDSVGSQSTIATALRLPVQTRASSRDFGYLDAMPVNFDVGGGGLFLEGSTHSHQRFQYLGRLGVTSTHTNIMIGGGYYLTPTQATRMTVVMLAGVEYGDFELSDDIRAPGQTFSSSDSGLHLGTVARFVVNQKFELNGGVGYSTYFEGDTQIFGGGYYHLTPRLDIMSRFELGDNDLLGIGIRYYY